MGSTPNNNVGDITSDIERLAYISKLTCNLTSKALSCESNYIQRMSKGSF